MKQQLVKNMIPSTAPGDSSTNIISWDRKIYSRSAFAQNIVKSRAKMKLEQEFSW